VDQRNQLRRRDDVGDRIDGTHFMKRDGVHFDAMHFCLRFGEQIEDRKRVLLDVGIEGRAVEFDANVRPRLVKRLMLVSVQVLVMRASLMVMRGICVRTGPLLRSRRPRGRPIRSNNESTAGKSVIAMRRESALPLRAKF
jgi:hypothetical protein